MHWSYVFLALTDQLFDWYNIMIQSYGKSNTRKHGPYIETGPRSLKITESTYTVVNKQAPANGFSKVLFDKLEWLSDIVRNGISLSVSYRQYIPLRWPHNQRDSVPNHQPHDCLLNRLFRGRWKKTSKLRITGLSVGNSPGTSEFPAQMASNAENVSIW